MLVAMAGQVYPDQVVVETVPGGGHVQAVRRAEVPDRPVPMAVDPVRAAMTVLAGKQAGANLTL
jgi:predicted ATP-grasp superfamily ATP-dependent carboligase